MDIIDSESTDQESGHDNLSGSDGFKACGHFCNADFADLCADLDRALLQTCPAVV